MWKESDLKRSLEVRVGKEVVVHQSYKTEQENEFEVKSDCTVEKSIGRVCMQIIFLFHSYNFSYYYSVLL